MRCGVIRSGRKGVTRPWWSRGTIIKTTTIAQRTLKMPVIMVMQVRPGARLFLGGHVLGQGEQAL